MITKDRLAEIKEYVVDGYFMTHVMALLVGCLFGVFVATALGII